MTQLVHTARTMFEARIAKYNDPHNLEWEWDDIADKWQRHAFSAFMDLVQVEQERDALKEEVERLQAHVKDLNHDLQASVNEANWQNRQGDEYGSY